jgi:uncharacterized SAM-binding protein YcdF (DUF218 family)
MSPLEERFPRRPLPQNVTGIIVLGGAFDMNESYSRNMVALNYRAERMTAFAGLARRYPQAALVFSGGNAGYSAAQITEAALAKRLFIDLGVPLNRMIFEDKSRNTRENALYSHQLVHVGPSDVWLLVTSAADMPRAVGSFRGVGWKVVAVPVDFHTRASFWATPGLIDGLREIDWSTHEWGGLLYYFLRGWTPELFPGPGSGHPSD